MAKTTPFTLKYQDPAAANAVGPATSTYTSLTCITALSEPKRKRGEVRIKCLTSNEDDVEAGDPMTDPGTFSIKWVADGDVEDLDALAAAGTIKQWCVVYPDSTVTIWDGFLSEGKTKDADRNTGKEVDYQWTVTRWWGRYDTHPA